VRVTTKITATPPQAEFSKFMGQIRAAAVNAWRNPDGRNFNVDVYGYSSAYDADISVSNSGGPWSPARQENGLRELDKYLRYIQGMVRVC